MLPRWLTTPDPLIYYSGNYVVLDFETTNLAKGNACIAENRLIHASWKCGNSNEVKEVYGSEYDMEELVSDIERANFFVAHNAKFELKWLARCGADLTKLLPYDTMIGEYVLAGNRKWKLGLGDISKKYGFGGKDPYVDLCMKGGVCPSEIPKSLLINRCRKDIRQTEEIFLEQLDKLHDAWLLPVMHTRCMFTPVLADMELRGMYVDEDRVVEEYNRLEKELNELNYRMEEATGGINPRSVPQMREFLYEVLKFKPLKVRGQAVFGTDTDTINQLKATNKRQREFLELKKEHAKVNALLTKSLQFLYGVVKEQGGLFYAGFNQCVTKTHRLSSSGLPVKFDMYDRPKSVQFQNFPRQYKSLFKARNEGWMMGEIDGAQLEFRVAAFIGQDGQAMADIRDGTDIHSFTAQTITDAGQPTDRQTAKAHTFKPLYGGTSGTEAEQAYYRAFKEKYSGVAAAQQSWLDTVVREKKLRLASGLLLYWPKCTIQKSGYITDQSQICNAPVQSLATAEMMPIAITYLWHRMKQEGMQSFLVNTIHDSAIGEVHPDEREKYAQVGAQAFGEDCCRYLDIVYGLKWNVPMGAGVKIGNHWGEGEEVVYTYEPEAV